MVTKKNEYPLLLLDNSNTKILFNEGEFKCTNMTFEEAREIIGMYDKDDILLCFSHPDTYDIIFNYIGIPKKDYEYKAIRNMKIGQDGGGREEDEPQVHVRRDGEPDHHRRAHEDEKSDKSPFASFAIAKVSVYEVARPPPEKHVNQGGQHVVAEGQRQEVQEVDVHREIAEFGPGGLEPSAVTNPQFRYGEVMNERKRQHSIGLAAVDKSGALR